MEAKKIRSGAFNSATSEWNKPFDEQVETAYLTIEADCKKEADKYIQSQYPKRYKMLKWTYTEKCRPSHGNQKGENGREFFYIIERTKRFEH